MSISLGEIAGEHWGFGGLGNVDLTGRATEDRPFRNNKPFVDLAHPKPPLAVAFSMKDFLTGKMNPPR